jgi:hypothetical protein
VPGRSNDAYAGCAVRSEQPWHMATKPLEWMRSQFVSRLIVPAESSQCKFLYLAMQVGSKDSTLDWLRYDAAMSQLADPTLDIENQRDL